MAQALLNYPVFPSSPISKSLIHSYSLQSFKNPSLTSRRCLLTKRIRCSASSDGGNILRTCKNCKTQFVPLLNHPRACRFHTAHFGGETKRKFESVYSGGTMDTPNSGEVLQYWHCCGSEDPFDSGCTASPHSTLIFLTFDFNPYSIYHSSFFVCVVVSIRMGDHLVLVVDRLSTNSGIGTIYQAGSVNKDAASESVSAGTDSCESEFVQCRICHDEDEDSNMDTPCSCSGTLKFAHHNCVQRWCNQKGDAVCEICRQQYKPGYTAPRQLFHYTGISMNLRNDWEIEGLDLRNPYFLTWDATDDYELYSFHSPTSLICCRVVALLFILLLFLRHFLPVFLGGIDNFSLTLLMLPLLKTLGILLAAYVFVMSFIGIQRCRQERDERLSGFSSDEETAPPRILMALPQGHEL